MNKEPTNKSGKALPLFFYAAIFTAIAIFMQGMAVVFGYEPAMQVRKAGNNLTTISSVLIFAEIVIFTLMTIFTLRGKKQISAIPQTSDASAFLSTAAGCVIIISSFILFFESSGYQGTAKTVTTAMAIFSVPTGIYFVLNALRKANEQTMTFLGFFPVLWAATCILRTYFEVGAAVNDPVRILFQLSFVAVMLSFLFELRLRIKKDGTLPLIIFSGISVIVGLSAVVSMAILFIIPRTITTGELLLSAAEFFICLDLLIKMYTELKEI